MPEPDAEITQLLRRAANGDTEAEKELFASVYGALRKIAAAQRSRERMEHTLSPTALVHEAYMRLNLGMNLDLQCRSHFFALAAKVMRRILVDHARRHLAGKRLGNAVRVNAEPDSFAIADRADEISRVDDVLKALEELNPRQSQIVELRFFGGFSEIEIAEIVGVGCRTVEREWQMAKRWLSRELRGGGNPK